MLVAHHVIDILTGAKKNPPLMDLPGVTPEDRTRAATMIYNAQKFDFGHLHLEPLDESAGTWKLPQLTEDERDFWMEGLIPLPYPAVWYEFTLNRSRSGLLIWQNGDDDSMWLVERIDYTERALLFMGIVSILHRTRSTKEELRIEIAGNVELYKSMTEAAVARPDLEYVTGSNINTAAMLAIYMTLMLHSRTTEIEPGPPPPAKLNRKRVSAGRAPLSEHRIVRIVPERYRVAAQTEAGGTHRPPRLHWRRSHLRHYDHHTPRSKWAPAAVHAGETGWWIAVIARQLVGRSDLGEISHEYRYESPKIAEGVTS